MKFTLFILLTVMPGQALNPPVSAATHNKIDFARDVRPILQDHCLSCHGPGEQMAGLRLDLGD